METQAYKLRITFEALQTGLAEQASGTCILYPDAHSRMLAGVDGLQ